MSYCKIHGEYYGYVCEDCGTAEWALRETVAAAAHAQANPGDYDCPHCRYRSLRVNASRCPLCHGEIEGGYWNDVFAREKAEAERKAARLKAEADEERRTAPARAAEEARRVTKGRQRRRNEKALNGAGVGATLGGIALGFAGCVSCASQMQVAGTPGFQDHIVSPFNLITGLLIGVIGGALIGAFIGFLIGSE